MNSINNAESANQIGYNNSNSGLTATDVQGALDEMAERIIQRTYYTISSSTATYGVYDWHANIEVEGYMPIMYCFQYGNTGNTFIGCEAFTDTEIFGYCSMSNLQITLRILYMKA